MKNMMMITTALTAATLLGAALGPAVAADTSGAPSAMSSPDAMSSAMPAKHGKKMKHASMSGGAMSGGAMKDPAKGHDSSTAAGMSEKNAVAPGQSGVPADQSKPGQPAGTKSTNGAGGQ